MSIPRYERYKKSGVEWLGEVPEHWDVLRVGRFATERRTKVSDKDYPPLSVTKFGVVPQLATAAKTDDGDNRKLVRRGDFVINGRSDRKGSSGLSSLDGSVSLINIVLELDGLNGQFAHHLFRSVPFQEEFYRYGKGIVADLWSTGFSEMSNILLTVPPVDEQEQIAKFIDRETAKIDALIEEQRRLIVLLKEKRQVVLSHAVTKGLNSTAPVKDSGVDWLGQVPSHWDVIPLGYLVRFYSGGTPSKENEAFWDGSLPWVSPKDMKVDRITDSEDHVTDEAVSQGGLRLYSENHVLVVVRGMILIHTFPVAINSVPVTINQDMKAVACSSRLGPKYLRETLVGLNRVIVSFADESAHGTLKLESSTLKHLPIPVPPVEEQEAIVDHLFRSGLHHFSLLHDAEHIIGLLEERRSALISAAVTGKINVTVQVAMPVRSTWNTGFARHVLAAETLSRCNGPRMGRVKLQKLIHLCEYHAQLDEVGGIYSRQAAGPFAPQVMEDVREGLLQQRWFEEYKDESRYAYRALEKAGEHKQYLPHWEGKQARIDQVLNLLGGELTQKCEIASTLYAAWNDLLIEGKNPTDAEIIHEASSAERWHESKEKIAAEKWRESLRWMRAKGLVPVGYGTHTTHQPDLFAREGHEPA